MISPKSLSFLFFSALCLATAEAAEPWTLEQCIDHAVTNNITVKSRAVDVMTGEMSVTEAKDRFLPQLSAYGSQSFNFGRGLTSQNTYANRNTSNFGWGVNMSLPLFQGLADVRRLAYARTNLRMLVEQFEAAKDDITLNVISQYLQVLYCNELESVAKLQLQLSQTELQRRRELLSAGKIPELDLTMAESQVAQDELAVVNAANNSAMALLELSQLLELESEKDFAIAPLPDSAFPLLDPDEVYANALANNHLIQASNRNIELADRNITLAKSGYLPTLSFSAGLGSSYYRVSGFDNESFGNQMRHNFNKSLGFSLNIPIFDAFSTRNSIRRAKAQKLSAELALDNTRNQLYKAIQQAYRQAISAEKKRRASQTACDATHAAFLAMQEKYNYGKANATEFEQSKTEYIRAESEAVQARYESILRTRILEFYNRH